MAKIIWHKSSSPPHTNGSVVFARWHQSAPCNTCFLRPRRVHNPNGISIGSAVFAQITAECPHTLQWAAPLPQHCPFPGGCGTASNIWFLGPTQVLNPNGISIGSAIFAGLRTVTDRPTDHATPSVIIGRIYVRSRPIAMRPKIVQFQLCVARRVGCWCRQKKESVHMVDNNHNS